MVPPKMRPGAPTKLTPSVRKTFLRVIRSSGFYRDACTAVGIDESTLTRWRRKGEAGQEPYCGFFKALLKAEANRRLGYLAESKRRGAKRHDAREVHWRAAVTDPDVFSIKHHLVVVEQLGAAIARLKVEFRDEPVLLERALVAISGERPLAEASGEGEDAELRLSHVDVELSPPALPRPNDRSP